MLLYDKSCGDIIILDNFIKIFVDDNSETIMGITITGEIFIILDCDNEEMAFKIVKDIYTKMTYGSENMIIDIEDYRIHCEDCIKFKNDACAMGTNRDPKDSTCIDFLGEEDGEDEEK